MVSCATLMLSFEMEGSWSSTQFHQDRVAAKLEELRQAHTSEEVAASADRECTDGHVEQHKPPGGGALAQDPP